MTTVTILNTEQVDALLEGVLRASGSRLGNYTYQKTLDELRSSIRAVEQAVLESPEIQALRKDAERILFIADDGCEFATWIQDDYTTKYRLEWNRGAEWQSEWFDTPEDAIDAAMEQQK